MSRAQVQAVAVLEDARLDADGVLCPEARDWIALMELDSDYPTIRDASAVLYDVRLDRWREHIATAPAVILAAWATSDLSEECVCAVWEVGAGARVQRIAAEGGRPWGLGEVSAEDAALLRGLLDRLGGRWPECTGTRFVLLDKLGGGR